MKAIDAKRLEFDPGQEREDAAYKRMDVTWMKYLSATSQYLLNQS